jgi:phage N-6-adenine-methyltransferase
MSNAPSQDLVLTTPIPGSGVVLAGWCEAVVVPWLKEHTETSEFPAVAAGLDGLVSAHRKLKIDTFELLKASRLLELRWGELLGPAQNGGDRRSDQFARERTDQDSEPGKDDRVRFRQLAASKAAVLAYIAQATDPEDLSRAAVLNAIKEGTRHIPGDDEWYTPARYIKAVHAVMGGIDLDPASSPEANEVVRAAQYFTAADNGLSLPWGGRVFLNPPYSLLGPFCDKLSMHYHAGEVIEACALTSNATETGWFQDLAENASAICFPRGRISFRHHDKMRTPTGWQGQAVFYLGLNPTLFQETLGCFGKIFALRRGTSQAGGPSPKP